MERKKPTARTEAGELGSSAGPPRKSRRLWTGGSLARRNGVKIYRGAGGMTARLKAGGLGVEEIMVGLVGDAVSVGLD